MQSLEEASFAKIELFDDKTLEEALEICENNAKISNICFKSKANVLKLLEATVDSNILHKYSKALLFRFDINTERDFKQFLFSIAKAITFNYKLAYAEINNKTINTFIPTYMPETDFYRIDPYAPKIKVLGLPLTKNDNGIYIETTVAITDDDIEFQRNEIKIACIAVGDDIPLNNKSFKKDFAECGLDKLFEIVENINFELGVPNYVTIENFRYVVLGPGDAAAYITPDEKITVEELITDKIDMFSELLADFPKYTSLTFNMEFSIDGYNYTASIYVNKFTIV